MSTLIKRYTQVRQATMDICDPLEPEDHVLQPVDFVSPPKWHLAHTTWFFEEFILTKYADGYKRFDQNFAYVFNSYYNTLGERIQRSMRGSLSRPLLAKVHEYRAHVDLHMSELLASDIEDIQLAKLIEIGLNHEQQHQELLWTDIKYLFGHNPLLPVYQDGADLAGQCPTEMGFLKIEEGDYDIGFAGEGFSFDNEHQRHQVKLRSFLIEQKLVTNVEYLEFIEDGGYANANLWLDEGWAWLQDSGVRSPMYWHKKNEEWMRYTLGGLKKLDPSAALAHVSHYEANAFAEWKGMRLPTEFEWEVAADRLQWGGRWEHTASAYRPYPGYRKPDGAVGEYNGKFMMNQMVLRGASSATSEGHSRKTYRNFFHPHMQWQFTGIRLAKDE